MDSSMKLAVALVVALMAGCSSERSVVDNSASVEVARVVAETKGEVSGDHFAEPTDAERYLMTQGVEIPTVFQSSSGLKAIVADNGQERRLMYVTPDGQNVIVGMVYDIGGRNVTNEDMSRANVRDVAGKAPLGAADLDALWARAGEMNWIEEGSGDRVVYAIFDPACTYCHRLYRGVREAVESGQVRVRWLPVAILSNSSKALGAAVYQAQAPLGAMAQMVTGELQPVSVEKSTAEKMAHNLLLLRDTGHTGVPLLLFKEKDGAVAIEPELPRTARFEQIFGS